MSIQESDVNYFNSVQDLSYTYSYNYTWWKIELTIANKPELIFRINYSGLLLHINWNQDK